MTTGKFVFLTIINISIPYAQSHAITGKYTKHLKGVRVGEKMAELSKGDLDEKKLAEELNLLSRSVGVEWSW